jgi:hypothetical protein
MLNQNIKAENVETCTNHLVSKFEDDWLRERFESHSRWIVELSNGERIIQDDGRPNVYPESAWLRLCNYCDLNGIYIENMYLQFRSHIEQVGRGKDGYYFCRSVLGSLADNSNIHMFNVGVTEGDGINVTKWRVPELIPFGNEVRTIDECKEFLICRSEFQPQ